MPGNFTRILEPIKIGRVEIKNWSWVTHMRIIIFAPYPNNCFHEVEAIF